MTDDMKKLFPLAAAFLAVAGCGLKTATFADEQVVPVSGDRPDSLFLSVSLEYPVKGASEEILDRMTYNILSAAFDLEEEPGTVEETATRYEDNLKDEFFNENETAGVADASWEDSVNGYFSGKYKNFRSYMIEYYGFRGGAHGINTMTPLVLDVRTGETVPEADFFAEGYHAPVAALLQAHLAEALENNEEDLQAVFEPDLLGPNGLYEVSADGTTWYFQPYDIAPYYLGVISITVPWAELKPYLAP